MPGTGRDNADAASLDREARLAATSQGEGSRRAHQRVSQSPERRCLMLQPVDLSRHRRCQRQGRSIRTKMAKLMLQMLFGVVGDIPDPAFGLEVRDKLPGDGHPRFIRQPAGAASGARCPRPRQEPGSCPSAPYLRRNRRALAVARTCQGASSAASPGDLPDRRREAERLDAANFS